MGMLTFQSTNFVFAGDQHMNGQRITTALIVVTLIIATPAMAQVGKRRGPMGKGPGSDPAFTADRELFHSLLEHRADIRRDVKKTDNGVETLTESDKPEVATMIQNHVASMEKRVKDKHPIHLRDPLFAEVFRHADKIKFVYEKTEKGMRVTETSDDAYVVKLIQAHAEVVSLFLKNGFDEVHRNHEVPSNP
jgi:hypothetical protein